MIAQGPLARTRNLRPTEGARFLLERQVATAARDSAPALAEAADTAPATRATYRASIHTPDGEFATTATLVEDGNVVLAGATGAPGDLDERLANIAKVVARDAPKRREDGLAVWPARIMRWRK